MAGNFRFGWGLSPYVTLGFESNAWSKSEGGTTVNFGVGAFTATYYPNPAQGFYMRAGVGHEMRLGQKWSLGPALDYGYTSVDVPGGSISANYVNFTAAFNWYFQ